MKPSTLVLLLLSMALLPSCASNRYQPEPADDWNPSEAASALNIHLLRTGLSAEEKKLALFRYQLELQAYQQAHLNKTTPNRDTGINIVPTSKNDDSAAPAEKKESSDTISK